MDDYLLKHVQHREYGVLAPEPKPRRRRGTFAPGHRVFNKGKKWSEWLSPEHQEKIREQLRRTRCNGNPNWVKGCKAHNAVEVVVFKDGRKVGIFQSATAAARELGLTARNVRHCVAGKRRSCGGYIFYRRDDHDAWLTALCTHSDVPPGFHRTATGRVCPYNRKRKQTI